MRTITFIPFLFFFICLAGCSKKEEKTENLTEKENKRSLDSITQSYGYLDLSSEVEPEVELVSLEPTKECNFQEMDDVLFDQGNYYLVSKEEGSIYKFSGKGKYINTFNKKGEGASEYSRLDACLVADGIVYVADNTLRKVFSYDKKYRLIGIYEIPSDCFLNSVFDYNVNVMVRYPNIECVYLINYLTQIAEVTAFDITFVLKDEPIYPFSENLHQNDTTLIPLKRKIDRYRFPVNTFLLPSEEGDTTKVYTELDPSTKKFLYENVYEFVYPKAPYILVFFKENGRSRFIDHNYDTKTSKIYEGFTHTGLGKTHFQNANFRIEKNTIYVLWNSFLNISSPSEIKILKDALAGDTEGLNNLQIQGTDHIQPIVIKFKIREDSFLYRPY